MATNVKTLDLVVTRLIDAPVEQVWQAWVDPELVKRWWGPDGFTAPLARIDFRPGGVSLLCMSSPQFGTHYSTWRYTQIEPMERIEYIHNLSDASGATIDPASAGLPSDFPQDVRNTAVFRRVGPHQTELTVTEYGWTEGHMLEMSRLGLQQCLAKLAAIFAPRQA